MRLVLFVCALSTMTIDVALSVAGAIGETTVDRNDECCVAECELGNFLLDAYVTYGIGVIRGSTQRPIHENIMNRIPVIAMLNGSAIKGNIPQDKITKDQLSKVLPDSTTMGRVTMQGSGIKKTMEKAVEKYNGITPCDEFLQISGLMVVFDPYKSPGERLHYSSTLTTPGELKDDEYYMVILSKNLWDNMWEVYGFDKRLNFVEFGKNLLEVAEEAISNNTEIKKMPEGRLRFLEKSQSPSASPTEGSSTRGHHTPIISKYMGHVSSLDRAMGQIHKSFHHIIM